MSTEPRDRIHDDDTSDKLYLALTLEDVSHLEQEAKPFGVIVHRRPDR